MEGFLDASSGSIVIEGHSVRSGMEGISGLVGICPQHDLLWESLTGREHLLFYARLHAFKVSVLPTLFTPAHPFITTSFPAVTTALQ